MYKVDREVWFLSGDQVFNGLVFLFKEEIWLLEELLLCKGVHIPSKDGQVFQDKELWFPYKEVHILRRGDLFLSNKEV